MDISTSSTAGLLSQVRVFDARAMPKSGAPNGPKLIELDDEGRARVAAFEEGLKNQDKVRAEIRERQDSIKLYKAYTVKGEKVGLQWANGWSSLFIRNKEVFDAVEKSDRDTSSGNLAQTRSKHLEAALRAIYGDALEVHDFSSDPNAPTMGELRPVYQHKKTLEETLSARSGSAGGASSLLSLTGTSMSLLHGRSR